MLRLLAFVFCLLAAVVKLSVAGQMIGKTRLRNVYNGLMEWGR